MPVLTLDVKFTTAAVGLTEGKAPATLSQRLGVTRIMVMIDEKDFELTER